ncbi:unnamed protein product [Rotaria socialis]|uniref:RRM domain-containing protein n=1 Tax=Rotaria socialis TaxID=392032 RepID=A0A819UND6_9BILA|nr:unnamed protein product [Rotaria socialis]CAF3422773.1 unnamed protein product [Rotaria socialis]CAF4097788.1 unnamed protein product [Rotaria socialis]CAF4102880.1 unnamed protein product [Rotaria socialis]
MSEHDTGSSDDEERINEIITTKRKKGNTVYQRANRPTTYDDDDDDEDEFDRQIRLEKTKKLQNEAEKTKTRVDPDGTIYEWDPNVKGWFPKVSEEFLVEHHMNYGLESSSGIRYDVHHQTYIQNRDGMSYKLDKETQQWIPLQSYTDETNHIKYTFSKKHNTWIPDVSTYSTNDSEGKQQTYVWLTDQLNWLLLSTVDAYTDHITRIKYKWNEQTNSWDNEGIEPRIEDDDDDISSKEKKTIIPIATQTVQKKPTEGWFEVPDEKNCNVYISGLPLDITDEEFEELLSKYGIISPDPNDSRQKKIRLYRDEQGNPKGDGRCRYLRPESVKLCIDMLDDTELRCSKIHVERAKFEVKGTFNPELKRKRKKIDKKTKQLEVDKLLNWDERPEIVRHKHERIIAMKNMFDLNQFKNDPLFIDKLRNQIRDSCSEYGEVKKINIYDANPAGVVTVGFADIEQADICCQYMNDRIWHGRVIECKIWDGSTKYDVAPAEEEEKQRIDEWHKYLNENDDEQES